MIFRKGAVSNFVVLFVWLFVILIFILVSYQVGTGVMDTQVWNTTLTQTSNGTSIEAASQASASWFLIKTKGFDVMFVVIYFLMHVLEITLAGILPLAGALFLGLNIIVVLVLAVFSGMLQSIMESVFVAFNLPNLGGTAWIISHFLILEIGFVMLLLFVMYKSGGGKE